MIENYTIFGHLERIEEKAWSGLCRTCNVNGSFPRGPPMEIWNEVIRSNLKERKVHKDLTEDINT